jgi:hypothetical protein
MQAVLLTRVTTQVNLQLNVVIVRERKKLNVRLIVRKIHQSDTFLRRAPAIGKKEGERKEKNQKRFSVKMSRVLSICIGCCP